ncbi:MAG: hypothetical protein E7663_07275 [Ruminococcaceae bacterium]|nr:hypothetical protein [Oscillospiraceae bacterium]
MKKRLIAAIVAIAIVLISLATLLIVNSVIKNKPPELSSLSPRIEALVEGSRAVNEILFGEGLPTYPRVYRKNYQRHPFYVASNGEGYALTEDTENGARLYYYTFTDESVGEIVAYQYCVTDRAPDQSTLYVDVEDKSPLTVADKSRYRYARRSTEIAEGILFHEEGSEYYYYKLPDYEEREAEFYYAESDDKNYDYVRRDCGYLAIEDIKKKAEQVYGSAYLGAVYEGLFTGITISDADSGTLYSRYIEYTDTEGNLYLKKSNTQKGFAVDRVYLYDTMRYSEKRGKKSNAKYVYVEMESYLESKPEEIVTICLGFVLQDGSWYLDTPTY